MKILLLFIIVLSFGLQAKEGVITIDRVVPNSIELAFPNKRNLQPELSDFAVDNVVLMSNKAGERWAVLTLTNQASGRRTLDHKQVMALVANGARILPVSFAQSFNANETLTVTLSFGESKFPLLSVYTRTE